ncbi:MAG: 2-oxoacid:ferredoxin oxidoreductase subunit gamma [Firmicutes bacterium]|nr:2-oxoacid:ferredoxin oxidoreductase subunit gamma [Bacillota bacterium]
MKEEIILAGFGGQGVMSIGKLIAYAGMKEGDEVSWMPSYGPEMRGGTANCTVIVSSDKIPSPLSSRPDTIIVMNLPSWEKFSPMVKKDGLVLLNSSLIDKILIRDDLEIIKVPANDIADEIGNKQIANMVMLGVYLARKGIVKMETVKRSLKNVLPERRHELIPVNEKALDYGAGLID